MWNSSMGFNTGIKCFSTSKTVSPEPDAKMDQIQCSDNFKSQKYWCRIHNHSTEAKNSQQRHTKKAAYIPKDCINCFSNSIAAGVGRNQHYCRPWRYGCYHCYGCKEQPVFIMHITTILFYRFGSISYPTMFQKSKTDLSELFTFSLIKKLTNCLNNWSSIVKLSGKDSVYQMPVNFSLIQQYCYFFNQF